MLLGGGAAAAEACTNTWTGAGGTGNWGDPANWSAGAAPGTASTTQDVCLPTLSAPYAVTLAPFQYNNSINNPPEAHLDVNSLTISSGATLIIHGASSNNNYSGSGGDATSLQVADGGSIAAGGTLELLATEDNDGGGASDNGGRGAIYGGAMSSSGTFTSVSQTSQGSMQSHQNQLGVSLTDLPGSTATVASGTLQVDQANHVTNQGNWTVASGAAMLLQYNGFNQSGVPATSFTNDGSYVNNGTTVMAQHDHGGVGNEESDPITWTQQGGSVTGNPIQLTDGAELADAAGSGAFLFNDQEGQIVGTIPAGQTVTVEADTYATNTYLNTLQLDGSQVVNQGTLTLHSPNVSTDQQTAIRLTGAQLTNQGTINAVADVPNLVNELDVSLANAHGAALNVANGTLEATGGQTVTNDGTITVAPGAQLQETANEFLTGPETFTNAADGTIAPQIAGASSFGTVQFGPDSTVNAAGTVAPALIGGYVPAVGAAFAAFPFGGSPTLQGTFGAVIGGFGADYTHETGAAPNYIGLVYNPVAAPAGPPAPPTTAPKPKPKPKVPGSRRPSVKGSKILVKLSCSKGRGCGKATVTATVLEKVKARHGKTRTEKVIVARASATLTAGKHKTVTLKLDRSGVKLVAKAHHLKATVTVSVAGRARKTYTVSLSHRTTHEKRHHKRA